MEKETIQIAIRARARKYSSDNEYDDMRTVSVEATRGDMAKKLDQFVEDLETSFEQ